MYVQNQRISGIQRKFCKRSQTYDNHYLRIVFFSVITDVKALYPSVPRVESRKSCEAALNKRTKPTLPTEDVLEIIDVVLENNDFEFNGKHYRQKQGTAIGSKS